MSHESMRKSFAQSPDSTGLFGVSEVLLLEDRYWTGRRVWVGFAGTLLFHLLAFFWIEAGRFHQIPEATIGSYNTYEIELLPEPVSELRESRFVTTSKGLAEELPEDTENLGARNQQAAQEQAPQIIDPDSRPSTEGRFNRESWESVPGSTGSDGAHGGLPPSLVGGETESVSPSPGVSSENLVSTETTEEELRTDTDLFESIEQIDEGIAEGSTAEDSESPSEVVEALEESLDSQIEPERELLVEEVKPEETAESLSEALVLDPILNPRPRPRVYRTANMALSERRAGVSRVGRTAVNAREAIGGLYSERLFEAIDLRWDELADGKDSHEVDTMAKMRFDLSKDGLVHNLEVLRSTMSPESEELCRRAIVEGQPYESWDSSMIHVFGESREIVMFFFYDSEE
ncbi:MAG: hypothetical protein F6K21_23950 [Symploca sp. SIO2D2]|nr:hypothetical protein [Symploca sp. SIO2D2]